jgi:hypothetical protein
VEHCDLAQTGSPLNLLSGVPEDHWELKDRDSHAKVVRIPTENI